KGEAVPEKKDGKKDGKKPAKKATKKDAVSQSKKFTIDFKNYTEASVEAMPRFVKPQLATLTDRAPEGENWLHEVKFDGYRLLARIEAKKCKLFTRNNNDWSDRFPKLI